MNALIEVMKTISVHIRDYLKAMGLKFEFLVFLVCEIVLLRTLRKIKICSFIKNYSNF